MAVDEALLESAGREDGRCTLRFYQWNEPTLSLGYFQPYADRSAHEPSRHCPVVRRQSGGGAILHDAEWTYSLTAPSCSPLAMAAGALYRAVHDALIQAMAGCGIEAMRLDASPTAVRADEPFLCFARRSTHDVILGDAKIAGSAQRRRHGALLQHGTLILSRSRAAPEIAGVRDVVDAKIDDVELLERWHDKLAEALGVELLAGSLSEHETSNARRLEKQRYATDAWNQKR